MGARPLSDEADHGLGAVCTYREDSVSQVSYPERYLIVNPRATHVGHRLAGREHQAVR